MTREVLSCWALMVLAPMAALASDSAPSATPPNPTPFTGNTQPGWSSRYQGTLYVGWACLFYETAGGENYSLQKTNRVVKFTGNLWRITARRARTTRRVHNP